MLSTNRRRLAAALSIAFALLVGVWLGRGSEPRESGAATPSDVPGIAQPRHDPTSTATEPSSESTDPERITLCEPGSPLGPPLEPPPEPWARVWLRGYVGAGQQSLEHSLVIARPGPLNSRLRTATTATSGWSKLDDERRFTIDISHMFQREADLHPSAVSVQLLLDDALPVEIDVDVTFTREDLARGGELVLQTAIPLPAICPVFGQARFADDSHAALMIAAFKLVDSHPEQRPIAVTHLPPRETSFRLDVDCEGELVLVAIADGFRPATLGIGSKRGAVDDLVIDRGATIHGRLDPGDGPPEGTIFADFANLPDRRWLPEIAGTRLRWVEQAFDLATHSTRTANDGSFVLVGLAPARYRLRVDSSDFGEEPLIVLAPAKDVVVSRPRSTKRDGR